LLFLVSTADSDSATSTADSDSANSAANDEAVEVQSSDSIDVANRAPTGLQSRPRFEAGLAWGYFNGFDYPGSTDPNRRQLAFPYFIYRSERFRIAGPSVSAIAIEKPRLRLDWSVAIAPNASSEENSARDGLEEIDVLFEVGPQLIWRVMEKTLSTGDALQIDWSTKLRGVLGVDCGSLKKCPGIEERGLVGETQLGVRLRGVLGNPNVTLFTVFSASAATERLQDYFYEVGPEFVTPTRPAYDAKGGLLSLNAGAGVALRLPYKVRLFFGAFNGFYSASVNRDSPLHEAVQSTTAVVGLVWNIAQSKSRVNILDTE